MGIIAIPRIGGPLVVHETFTIVTASIGAASGPGTAQRNWTSPVTGVCGSAVQSTFRIEGIGLLTTTDANSSSLFMCYPTDQLLNIQGIGNAGTANTELRVAHIRKPCFVKRVTTYAQAYVAASAGYGIQAITMSPAVNWNRAYASIDMSPGSNALPYNTAHSQNITAVRYIYTSDTTLTLGIRVSGSGTYNLQVNVYELEELPWQAYTGM